MHLLLWYFNKGEGPLFNFQLQVSHGQATTISSCASITIQLK